jgi:integrase
VTRKKKSAVITYRRGLIRATRYGTFRAEFNRDGQRQRKSSKTLEGAKDWINRTVEDVERQGEPLLGMDYCDAQAARALLPAGVALADAARFWLDRHPAQTVLLGDAAARYLAGLADSGVRPRTLESARSRVGVLLGDLSGRELAGVTEHDLLKTLAGRVLSGVTRNNYRRDWSAFFAWCIGKGWLKENPAAQMGTVRLDQSLPEALTVHDAWRLLRTAERQCPELVPYIALGLFAGIRPDELARLKWEAIRPIIDPRRIHLGPQVTKARRQRYVTVTPNLKAWLLAYPAATPGHGRITPWAKTKLGDAMRALREAAAIRDWPGDALRHTFATHHVVLYQDAGRTSHELGHAGTAMLFDHYRALATDQQARRYFALHPRPDGAKTSR